MAQFQITSFEIDLHAALARVITEMRTAPALSLEEAAARVAPEYPAYPPAAFAAAIAAYSRGYAMDDVRLRFDRAKPVPSADPLTLLRSALGSKRRIDKA